MANQLECEDLDKYLLEDPVNQAVNSMTETKETFEKVSTMAVNSMIRTAETFEKMSMTAVRECEHVTHCCKYQDLQVSEIERLLATFINLKETMCSFIVILQFISRRLGVYDVTTFEEYNTVFGELPLD